MNEKAVASDDTKTAFDGYLNVFMRAFIHENFGGSVYRCHQLTQLFNNDNVIVTTAGIYRKAGRAVLVIIREQAAYGIATGVAAKPNGGKI